MTPVDQLLGRVDWKATGNTPGESGLPYATHSGVLEITGCAPLRCYRLNTGQAVFDADDFEAFFGDLLT